MTYYGERKANIKFINLAKRNKMQETTFNSTILLIDWQATVRTVVKHHINSTLQASCTMYIKRIIKQKGFINN